MFHFSEYFFQSHMCPVLYRTRIINNYLFLQIPKFQKYFVFKAILTFLMDRLTVRTRQCRVWVCFIKLERECEFFIKKEKEPNQPTNRQATKPKQNSSPIDFNSNLTILPLIVILKNNPHSF